MKITRSIRISRSQLLSHRLRTALALLGIIIGVSAVIIMVSVGNGAQKEVLSQIKSMGTDLIIINAGQVQKSAGMMTKPRSEMQYWARQWLRTCLVTVIRSVKKF